MAEIDERVDAFLEGLRALQADPSTAKAVQVAQDWEDRQNPYYNASEERAR